MLGYCLLTDTVTHLSEATTKREVAMIKYLLIIAVLSLDWARPFLGECPKDEEGKYSLINK